MAMNKRIVDPLTGKSYPTICGGSGAGDPPTPNVDPASGFPEARPQEQHPLLREPQRDDQGRFTTDDIEKARREERDKLYPQLEKLGTLEQQVQSLTQMLEDQRSAAEQAAEADAAAAQEAATQAELLARNELEAKDLIHKVEEDWQTRFTNLEKEYKTQQAVLAKERELQALDTYRAGRLNELIEAQEIAPQFIDYVFGDSQQEIEASIERAKIKTAEIVAEFQQATQEIAEQQQYGFRNIPGVRATAPAMGPLEEQGATRTFSPEEIQAMSPAEYARHRHQLLPGAAKSGRGLFG